MEESFQYVSARADYYLLSPEKRAKWNEEGKAIFERWKKKIQFVVNYHSVGMSKFDGFEIWECTDIGDWEAAS